jgi:hypothetical protein
LLEGHKPCPVTTYDESPPRLTPVLRTETVLDPDLARLNLVPATICEPLVL